MQRLQSVSPELVELLDAAHPSELRRVAILAARWAVARSGLRDETVRALLDAEPARSATTGERETLQLLITTLDAAYWDLQDKIENGTEETDAELAAFRKARAASAVAYAVDPQPRIAAFEAVYEACKATDDPSDLTALLINELSQAG